MRTILALLLYITCCQTAQSQPYRDASIPVEARVQDLLERMTPEEKFWQLFMLPGDLGADSLRYRAGLFGFQVSAAAQTDHAAGQMLRYDQGAPAFEAAVQINALQRFFREETRLGIPIIPFDEALHGLVRPGATAFPQAIGLAATWNTALVHEVADAMAAECRSRGIRQILSPVVNVATDVRWGRTEETYGEDPFLVSEMGVAFVSAFEREGVVTTPKHFVANVGDGGRDSYPIHLNERGLREIHLPPFEACIRRGGARSLMTAYNSYDGRPCTANEWLLRRLLKAEWGFRGFVISDAGATGGANVLHFTARDYADATAQSITAGLDVVFQTDYNHHNLFDPPFYDGSIDQQAIDEAVARVLRVKFELGLFENPYVDPEQAAALNGQPAHRALAKKAALESIVLLQNDRQVLPIASTVRTIAVIGPDAAEARLGGYSGPGNTPVSILKGIRERAGDRVAVEYAEGCLRQEQYYVTVPDSALSCMLDGRVQSGLLGAYFNNVTWAGDPVLVRRDPRIQFQWTLFSPDPERITYDFYAVRWTGQITATESGRFQIGIDGNDGYRLYLDGKLLIDNMVKRTRQTKLADFQFEKGRAYDLQIEFYEPSGNAWFRLVWNVGVENRQRETIRQAAQLASRCDVAVVVVGIEEGEFLDRADLRLPGRQEELIEQVAATGTPVVVVLVGGSAVDMRRWIGRVPGILAVWYPGEAGGQAVAEVLFGGYSPAGRLPITFPVSAGQLPLVYNHKPTGRGDDYLNHTGKPQFPFGFGLSYTRFEYTAIRLEADTIAPGDTAFVSVRITNSGKVAGDEVVQLYLRDELASVARPVMELKGFGRLHLQPGESRDIRFVIDPGMLAFLGEDLHPVIEPGAFRIMIGASSQDIRQRAVLVVR
ncbi:MAG: glycoside hydrolase family 3 C-terminal domain-containing protein [Lewinellaceae bacterium]|nr:glycoside hydrolase family 3 C-terminal domain-containing protein [Saprospiraceae bacterium]MCB9330929.1 glycoside hydrolase family 3 C-terminal domain-containing protein [Lewinellaceae bacterium]